MYFFLFQIIITVLLVSYGSLVLSEEKVDDLDDWSLEDDTQNTEVAATTIKAVEGPKEPVSHIQKIPRRGEKLNVPNPAVPVVRKRRNTEKEAAKKEVTHKERKRQNKNRQKDLAAEGAIGADHPETNQGVEPGVHHGKNKKVRKQKGSKKPKITNDDQSPQTRKERKGKKDKTRKPKAHQDRSRPPKVRKNNGQSSPKSDSIQK